MSTDGTNNAVTHSSQVTITAAPSTDSVVEAAAAAAAVTAAVTESIQEKAKRDAISQKIRDENRERKKRWRQQNEDRNKDNDLRCRVNKRANKILEKADSETKARWIEEEFSKRQAKRKEKERKRNPNATAIAASSTTDLDGQLPSVVKPPLTLSEHLALHAVSAVALPTSHQELQHQQLQVTAAALNPANPQFDPNTVKTALALSDLVKKNGSHLDLAQLTGVLSDPNLARQLLELEASTAASAQPAAPMVLMNTTSNPAPEVSKASQMMDTEYPMDAVLTLMQLNGSWKA
ncbi:hypothetical protein BGX21_007488 [Mortierella sp. AD011]|nr:hypothetical protein BGX20_003885 [Mortierella sp. AD010]KAF9403919.1 hypothetical protein BGX21_007488 [Mortierella sp. AD011]